MKLHKEAFPTLFFATVIFILFNVAMWRLLNDYPSVFNVVFLLTLILLTLVIYFFRVPFEVLPVDTQKVISPAHGKVVEIVDEIEPIYFKDKRKRISIFMSPLNIHCNYVPISGTVTSMNYFSGKYLVAFHPKSSQLNEHTFTTIQNDHISIGVKQIAGFVARRIVPYLQGQQKVEQNDELGFIKFGSRVDLYLPPAMEISVAVGDKVVGGVTEIAKID